jgi:hypothetical protein
MEKSVKDKLGQIYRLQLLLNCIFVRIKLKSTGQKAQVKTGFLTCFVGFGSVS